MKISQRDRAISDRHLPRSHHLISVREPANGPVANRDQEALGRDGGRAQHINDRLL